MRTCRPVVKIELSDEDAGIPRRLYAATQDRAGLGIAGADRIGLCAAGLRNKAVAARER